MSARRPIAAAATSAEIVSCATVALPWRSARIADAPSGSSETSPPPGLSSAAIIRSARIAGFTSRGDEA
jgi:hypothetical protein